VRKLTVALAALLAAYPDVVDKIDGAPASGRRRAPLAVPIAELSKTPRFAEVVIAAGAIGFATDTAGGL
jgi:hypothetical protein